MPPDPVAPFAVRRDVVIGNEAGRRVTLSEVSLEAEATPSLCCQATAAMEAWPDRWTLASIQAAPVSPCPWGNAPQAAREYRRRVRIVIDQATTAGIEGAEWLHHAPAGWLPVLEIAVRGLAALKERPEHRPALLRIVQLKEKFGTLRFYTDATGGRDFRAAVSQIATWAELCCEARCMVTGMPGTLREGGRILTLSDDAARLRTADPDTFSARLYPSP